MDIVVTIGIFFKHMSQWINSASGNSEKKRDFLSCLIFAQMGAILGASIHIITPMWGLLVECINQLVNVIKQIQNNLFFVPTIEMMSFDYDLPLAIKEITKLTILAIIGSIPIVILKITRKNLIFVMTIVQIVTLLIFYENSRKIVMLFVITIFIINVFIPIGKGDYFNIFKYISYIPNIYFEKEPQREMSIMQRLCLILGGGIFVVVCKLLVPVLSVSLLLLLLGAIILLIWINNTKDKIRIIIRKILVYSLIVPFVLLNNNIFEAQIEAIILALVSIFFAIDRVMVLFKDFKRIIEEDSLLFLLEDMEENKLWEMYQELPLSEEIIIPEQKLLKQIIIGERLGLTITQDLIETYWKNNYKAELHLVDAIYYFRTFEEGLTLQEYEEKVEKIYNEMGNGIIYAPLLEEYAYILFYQNKDSEEIIKVLEQVGIYMMRDLSKYILYCSYLQEGNNEAAESVQREIEQFEKLEKMYKKSEEFAEL